MRISIALRLPPANGALCAIKLRRLQSPGISPVFLQSKGGITDEDKYCLALPTVQNRRFVHAPDSREAP